MRRPSVSNTSLTSVAPGKARLSGELTFESVPSLLDSLSPLLTNGGSLELDLSGVSRCDSGGVALLLSWERQARAVKSTLRYCAVPEQLQGLARVSGVEQILQAGV